MCLGPVYPPNIKNPNHISFLSPMANLSYGKSGFEPCCNKKQFQPRFKYV